METRARIERTLRSVVEKLVSGDYRAIEVMTHGIRLRASEIEGGVHDYGRQLVMPPADAFDHVDVIQVSGANPPAFSIRFRLYTREEGLSDLELQATFIDVHDCDMMSVELDNILVA